MNRFVCLFVLCVCLLATGCATNTISLTYGAPGLVSPQCVGDVTVLAFGDKRAAQELGRDQDNKPFRTDSDVSEWMGWALFDELTTAGCTPKYRTTWDTANQGKTVTGEITQVSLNQTGTSQYRAVMKMTATIFRDGEKVHTRNITSEVERVVLPGVHDKNEPLAEALKGVMEELIPVIIEY